MCYLFLKTDYPREKSISLIMEVFFRDHEHDVALEETGMNVKEPGLKGERVPHPPKSCVF